MSNPGRVLALLCVAGLSAGCTGASESEVEPVLDESARSSAPDAPSSSAVPDGAVEPRLIVVAAPEGLAEPQDVTSSGWRVHLQGDGCALLSQGAVEPSTAADVPPRDRSVAALDTWRDAAGGTDAGEVTDVLLAQDGEPVLAGQVPTGVNFVTQDWTQVVGGTEQRVRAAARSATSPTYDGDITDQTLRLAFQCAGTAVDEAAWQSVLEIVRPDVWVAERETLHDWVPGPHGAG